MDKDYDRLLTALWAEHKASLCKIAEIKLRSHPGEADDVIADVFTALCEYTAQNGPPQMPKNWLYATLNNVINLKYREIYKRNEKETPLSEKVYELPYTNDVIDEKIDEIYNAEIMGRLRQLLTDDEYKIICAVHFDKMKMREIAQQYNTTEAAIKQKHYRICRKLKKLMKNSKNFF